MFRKLLMAYATLICLLGAASLNAWSQPFDPTKPPIFQKKPVKSVKRKAPRLNVDAFKVTSILVSSQRRVAVINNQVVGVGDKVTAEGEGQAIVRSITASSVKLSKAKREFVVQLPSWQYSRTVAGSARPTDKESH